MSLVENLYKRGKKYYTEKAKPVFVKLRSLGEKFHIDMEYELIDEVGESQNIYGGDLLLDPVKILWEAHPNINRNRELGTASNGRVLKDENLIAELSEILMQWIL